MNLAIDIGNTRTKLAFFRQGEILDKTIMSNPLTRKKFEEFLLKSTLNFQPNALNVILSATSNIDKKLEKYLLDHFFYLNLSAETKLPIENRYKTPKTLGKDRVAAAVGAYFLYPKQNCLVVDAGTCITYELLHAEGAYLGGNISPGVKMRLEAMNHFTAKLPLIEKQRLETTIGYNTETALRVGGQLGAVQEVEGFIRLYKQQFSDLQVILTGGDAVFFEKNIQKKVLVNEDLVLIGLNEILNYNVKNQR